MRSSRLLPLFILFLALGLLFACGGGGGGGGGGDGGGSSSSCSTPAAIALPNGSTVAQALLSNVMTLTVNGSTCSAAFNAVYPNKPCVSVTICDSGGGNCQSISDILLDTGDNGLRIFRQAIQALNPALLSALENGTNSYECIEYGDGATVWGQVATARVTLGGEAPIQIPIQVIGSSTSDANGGGGHWCPNQLTDVNHAGYNGSLGLGLFAQDCGSTCQNSAANGQYFTCNAGTCNEISVVTASQVANPVASLASDNNGVIVRLPSVSSAGAPSAAGFVILGIGTQANNAPSGVTPYGANAPNHFAYFTTAFNGVSYQGFLDTGSNGIFVNFAGQPSTTGGGFYTPSCTLSLSATNTGYVNAPNQGAVPFQIADARTLAASGNSVFFNLGGPIPNSLFDWGLPFFLGRNVYIGIEGRVAPGLATGPFWAY